MPNEQQARGPESDSLKNLPEITEDPLNLVGLHVNELVTDPLPAGIAVGRIVHFYYSPTTQPEAAIISRVRENGVVDLTLFPSNRDVERYLEVPYSTVGQVLRTWRFPPRV